MIYACEHLEFIYETVKVNTIKETTKLFNDKFKTNLRHTAIGSIMKCRGIKTGRDGRFSKGQVSPNKGIKGLCYEGCKATQFKKGGRSSNWAPIGTKVWRDDGYLWEKVSEDKNPYRKNWIQKHRLIWEETHGEVPRGYQVMFADQDKTNIRLDNLILVTAAEKAIMSKNGLFYKNADATRAGITIAKIISKASKRKRGGTDAHKRRSKDNT